MPKITRLESIPLSIPESNTSLIGRGRLTSSIVITRVFVEGGVFGVGVSAGGMMVYSGESFEDVCMVQRKFFAPLLVGEDAFNVERIMDRLDGSTIGHEMAKAGVDIALYDLLGKLLNLPVYVLLGGVFRERFPVKMQISIMESGLVLERAKRAVELGVKAVCFKGGRDPERDVAVMKLLREELGEDLPLQVDFNQGYRPNVAISTIKKLEKYNPQFIEQPVLGRDILGLRHVKRSVSTPITADESIYTPLDAMNLIRLEAADAFNVKLQKCGGFHATRKVVAIAEAAGIPCSLGIVSDGTIGIAALRHAITAFKGITLPGMGANYSIGVFFENNEGNLLKEQLPEAENGYLTPPKGPGLGIQLNEESISKYQVSMNF